MVNVPASVEQVYNNLVEFFAKRHGHPPSSYTPATDVRARHVYTDAAWVALRGPLTLLPWMKALGVALSPLDMLSVSTLWQIANMIWGKRTTNANFDVATAKPRTRTARPKATKPRRPTGRRTP